MLVLPLLSPPVIILDSDLAKNAMQFKNESKSSNSLFRSDNLLHEPAYDILT